MPKLPHNKARGWVRPYSQPAAGGGRVLGLGGDGGGGLAGKFEGADAWRGWGGEGTVSYACRGAQAREAQVPGNCQTMSGPRLGFCF
jgi:hypothetical protein